MADTNDTAITNTPVVDHHGGLSIYKPGQGYYTRMGTVVGATMVSLLGILWLWSYLIKMRIGSLNPLLAAAGGSIIIGGLITSTFLSLLVIPVLFTYVDDAVQKLQKLFHRRDKGKDKAVALGGAE